MKEIGGLESNRINQLVVEPTLQTTRDADIYAIGDCASCARPEGGFVPRARRPRTRWQAARWTISWRR